MTTRKPRRSRDPNSSAPESPRFTLSGDGDRIALAGALDIRSLGAAKDTLAQRKVRALDLAGVSALDTPGAQFLCALQASGIALTGVGSDHRALLDLVCGLGAKPLPKHERPSRWHEVVIGLGRGAEDTLRDTVDIITFLGRVASALAAAIMHPRTLRLPAISRHIAETGINALPIVGLMAVMISVVVAYQGVVQLRPYGSEELTVDLVAVSVLREMGVLVTAIIVAGRSGSAFTAEIGVMKARDEIDALTVMGLDPMAMLVIPRVIALVIALPLLTFFADVMGVAGGAIVCQSLLHVSPEQYLQRVQQAVDTRDLFVGLVKAPIFAAIVSVIGCMHGLRVHGSAESVGVETTRAVVKSIFLVIVLDALFSILFEKLGL